MAVTHRAIVSMFMTRRGGIEALARRYHLPVEYVEDALRYRMNGRKPRKVTSYKPAPFQMDLPEPDPQMTIEEKYGVIQV